MSFGLRCVLWKSLALLATVGAALLCGCGTGTLAGPSDVAAFKIQGDVHGGAYPIQNATVRLWETTSNGMWNPASNSYVGAARQILKTTSDSTGFFTFPDTGWSCTAGQFVYVEVSGGHTTGDTNDNVIQIGVIGSCSADLASKAEIDNVNLFISEPSTVAAAYALNSFISISTGANGQPHVNITAPAANNSATPGCTGLGATGVGALQCQHAGLAHAFANAYNLVDSVRYDGSFPTGAARATLPGNNQAIVPQALINTLGNIMQSCVDSAGGVIPSYATYVPGAVGSTRCGDLFYWATPPGSTTPPTNTLQVALNIANNPTNHVDQLFRLQPRAVFFSPDMAADTLSNNGSQLMAYTLSIFYLGTGLANDGGMPYPVDIALDANDNAYVAYSGGASGTTYGAVNEFGPDGTGVFAGAHQSAIQNPASLALDSKGHAWLSNDAASNGNVYGINTPASGGTLGAIGQTLTVRNGYASGLALDMSNNVWAVRDAPTNQSLFRFNAANFYAADPFATTPVLGANAKRIFVDTKQNVLGVTSSTDAVGNSTGTASASMFLFPYASGAASTTLYSTALSAGNAYGLAMSNSDVAYVPVYQQLNTETGYNTGAMTANGAGSYTGRSGTGATYSAPMGVAMDGAGNLLWSDYEAAGQIYKFVPSASPSVTSGTLTSFVPCYAFNGQCSSSAASYLRGMAIDSSGALWYVADSATGAVVQTLGFAAPSYPLLSYAHGGVIIQ